MANKQQKNNKKLGDSSGIFVPAGLFIGMGAGFALMALTQYLKIPKRNF